MTKQQARAIFLAGAGLSETNIQICNGTRKKPPPFASIDSIDRMLHCARFEEWWSGSKQFSRAKEPRRVG